MITNKEASDRTLSPGSASLYSFTGLPYMDIDGRSTGDEDSTDDERGSTNEDSFLTAELMRSMTLGPSSLALRQGEILSRAMQGRLLAVADGSSSGGGGGVASSIALRFMAGYMTNVMEWFIDDDHDDERMHQELEVAFERCQRRIRGEARRLGYEDQHIGTTLTMAYIVWPHMYLAHVGDSRAYLYRDQTLTRLTSAHTLTQHMVDQQLMVAAEAEDSRFGHILTNAVGGARKSLDVEFHCMDLQAGDALLLCTKSLTAHVEEYEVQEYIDTSITSETCCRQLIELAESRGGQDPITVVLGRLDSPTQELQQTRS